MNRDNYIQSSATTRIYEKRLLGKDVLNRLIDSDDMDDIERILSETVYADSLAKLPEGAPLDEFLSGQLIDMFNSMYKSVKDKELVEILAAEYIFHNLKTIMKGNIMNEDFDHLLFNIGEYDIQSMKVDLETEGRLNPDQPFAEYVNRALDIYEETDDPQKLDMSMDQAMFKYIMELADKMNIQLITDYTKDMIDLQNLKMMGRGYRQNHRINCVEEFMIDGGNIPIDFYTDNYFEELGATIDKLKKYRIYGTMEDGLTRMKSDNKLRNFNDATNLYLNTLAKEGQRVTYGPEVLFSYMLAKANEIKVLRIIIIGKRNGLSPKEIRERLSDLVA